MINDGNINLNISIENILKTQILSIDILSNSALLDEMKSYGLLNFPSLEINIDNVFDASLCDNWNLDNLSIKFNNPISEYKEKRQQRKLKKEIDGDNDRSRVIKNLLNELWNDIKNQFIIIYEGIITTYLPIINFFESNFRDIIILYKRLKSDKSEEDKKQIKANIKKKLDIIGGDIVDMFNLYIIVDFIESSWKVIKNLFGSSRKSWKKTIENNKHVEDLLNENRDKSKITEKYINTISSIISILGQLGVIAVSIVDCIKAQKELDEQLLNDSSILNEIPNRSSLSNIITSGYIEKDNNDKDIISICPVYEESDANIIGEYNGYIIEIANDIQDYNLHVNINEKIVLDQEIGNIKNVPIKSKITGIVKDVKDRYIIIEKEYNENINNDILNIKTNILNYNISDDSNANEINDISEKLTDMNEIEILVKDYLNLLYEPILYSQCVLTNRIGKNTIDKEIKKLRKTHKKLKDQLDTDIQLLCDKDNIKNSAENDNLSKLTNEIIDKKCYIIDSIFNNINYYENNKSFTISKNNNYEFCDYYITFLLSSCENNKNYDKLYKLIRNFYINRFNYEGHNISSLIRKFNKILKDDDIKKIKYDTINKEFKGELTFDNIKKYISSKYDDKTNSNINILSNLYLLINDIKKLKNVSSNSKSLYDITKSEAVELLNFIKDINAKYNNYKNILNDINSCFNYVNWPKPSDIYINNIKYEHYLFIDESNINEEIYDIQPNNIKYWLKYCGMATLMNCATPNNWATGITISGAPILMPIILVPIKYIDGDIGAVIGLGICGICIYPMMIIINNTDQFGSILLPVNMLINEIKRLIQDSKINNINLLSISAKSMIETLNKKIKNTEDDIILIKKQISLYKNL